MKRLLILRHAKAVTRGSETDDHARILNERGRADAARMGDYMRRKAYRPSSVLCSTSARTRETWECLGPLRTPSENLVYLDEIYLAPWGTIVDVLRSRGGVTDILLILGHNPGLEECAHRLARRPKSDGEHARLDTLTAKFPTCALAVLDFEIEAWKAVAPGTGDLVDFVRPRDL